MLLCALAQASAALTVGGAARATSTSMLAASSQLNLVEHKMPLMAPHLYEHVLRDAMADRGALLRWYIGRVDEASGTTIAECVLLPHQRTSEDDSG